MCKLVILVLGFLLGSFLWHCVVSVEVLLKEGICSFFFRFSFGEVSRCYGFRAVFLFEGHHIDHLLVRLSTLVFS